jgi:hypothetical protein
MRLALSRPHERPELWFEVCDQLLHDQTHSVALEHNGLTFVRLLLLQAQQDWQAGRFECGPFVARNFPGSARNGRIVAIAYKAVLLARWLIFKVV